MDYYQKYQKYRFKYLNLLNQFGGGYTPEQFTQMLKKKEEDNEELLEDTDFLTLEKINIRTAILINMQVYDVNSLFEWINIKYNKNETPTLPLTNGNLSLSNLVDIRNKLDNDEKKNIIQKIIVSKLPERVQNIFKELNKEQLDIIFTITKISILKDISIDLIEELFSKYKYLLDNDIIDNEIIDALKKDYNTLLLVPEKKMTDNIIKLAVIHNGFALVYVPVHMIKPDICEKAVKQNGNTLQYIPNDLRTFTICEAAVKKNARAFHYVLADKMTFQEYLVICNIAVKHNGTILQFVPKDFRTYEICKSAVKEEPLALKYVLADKMTSQEYFIICSIAVEENAFALEHVLVDKMTSQEYLIICYKAVEKDADALYYVPDELKNELKKYFNLLSSIQSGGSNYTKEDFDLLDKYQYEYEYVIQQNKNTSETRALFELIDDDGYLLEKNESGEPIFLEDNITTDPIHITKAVLIGNNVHDVNSILNSIKNKMDFDPFTREPFKITDLLHVINKLNNENENDKQFIINYIISSKLNYKIKKIVNSFTDKQKKILISKNKIDILLTFSKNIYIDLLLKYNHLLSDTITEDDILKAIKENYRALILVPENKKTNLICLNAVNSNANALKFVPEYIKTYEICSEAVKKDGLLLAYVPKQRNIFAICEIAVKQNSYALEYVNKKNMTFDEYLYICELALNKDNLRNFDIIELSLLAVTNCWLALQYVKLKNMTFDEYYQICKSAIENNVSALQYVDKNVSKDEYYDICYFAVITNPLAFQYVDKEIIPEKYYDICKLALQYLDSDRYEITIEEIYKICELAVKYDSSLINFVPKEKILSSQLVNLLKIGNLKFNLRVNKY